MTEKKIALYLAMSYFKGRHLVTVPNCHWANGHESDLLLVNKQLRAIDYEIKISRSDFKADAKKSKWLETVNTGIKKPVVAYDRRNKCTLRYLTDQIVRIPRPHPRNIYKHYYVMPEQIWCDSLLESMASQKSGVLLVHEKDGVIVSIITKKRAVANPNYKPLTNHQVIDIARLASLRMWSALEKLEND